MKFVGEGGETSHLMIPHPLFLNCSVKILEKVFFLQLDGEIFFNLKFVCPTRAGACEEVATVEQEQRERMIGQAINLPVHGTHNRKLQFEADQRSKSISFMWTTNYFARLVSNKSGNRIFF